MDQIHVKLPTGEKEKAKKDAYKHEMTLSEYIRHLLKIARGE